MGLPRPNRAVKPSQMPLNPAPTRHLSIFVFGAGGNGELGLGHLKRNGKEPRNVKRPRWNDLLVGGVVDIAVGGMHCIVLTATNKLDTWGVNDNGALGRDTKLTALEESESEDENDSGLNPKESTPTMMGMDGFEPGARFAQVVATDSASFVLTEEGNVYGWGTFRGADGVIGFTKDMTNLDDKTQKQPILIPELKKITRLSTAGNHVLALDSSGKLFSFGSGGQGQLGRPVMEKYQHRALEPHSFGLPRKRILSMACGSYHSFAIDEDNHVWAWGLNNFGQTGISNGAGTEGAVITKPRIVQALRDFKIADIQGGTHHSIACTEDGKVLVWGRCDDGQAGILMSKIPNRDIIFNEKLQPKILIKPTVVPGIVAHKVAAGIDNCFAVTKAGEVYSWGFSADWRTGLGTEEPVLEATKVENSALKGRKISFAGCGGQFSVLAGPES